MSVARITKKKSAVRLDADELVFQLIGSFLHKADDWRSLCLVSKNASLIRHHKRYFTVKLSENWHFGLQNMKGLWLHTKRGGSYECDFDPKEVRDLVGQYYEFDRSDDWVNLHCIKPNETNFGLRLLANAVLDIKRLIISKGEKTTRRVVLTELTPRKTRMNMSIYVDVNMFLKAVNACCEWDLSELTIDKLKKYFKRFNSYIELSSRLGNFRTFDNYCLQF